MTPELFRRIGAALFGSDDWRPRMRDMIGVSDRTFRRWLAGTEDVPASLARDLAALVNARRAELDAIAASLPAPA